MVRKVNFTNISKCNALYNNYNKSFSTLNNVNNNNNLINKTIITSMKSQILINNNKYWYNKINWKINKEEKNKLNFISINDSNNLFGTCSKYSYCINKENNNFNLKDLDTDEDEF